MSSSYCLFIFLALSLGLSACSNSSVGELINGSKNPPNENEVVVNKLLSIPPDYSLRPPVETFSITTAGAEEEVVAKVKKTPSGYNVTTSNELELDKIDDFHSDGRKKTKSEKAEELRRKYIAEKQKHNPNYGTWKNIVNAVFD